MRPFLLSIVFLFTSFNGGGSIFAQDSTNTKHFHEIGIGTNGTSAFNLRYQWGNDQLFYRINAASLTFSNSDAGTAYQQTMTNASGAAVQITPSALTPINLNVGTSFSVGKINPLNEKIGLVYAAAIGFNFAYSNATTNYSYLLNNLANPNTASNYSNYSTTASSSSYNPFIGATVGIRYRITSHLHVYAEINPSLNYTLAWAKSVSTTGINTPASSLKYTDTYTISGLSLANAIATIQYRIF